MNFGDLLTRAWKITWRHKALWLFGLLASCSARSGGVGGSSNVNWQPSEPAFERLADMERQAEIWGQWVVEHPAVLFAGLILLFIFSLLSWLLGTFGISGLISGAARADEDPQAVLTLAWLWEAAWQPYPRLLGLSLINGLFVLLSLAVFFGPSIAMLIAAAVSENGGIAIGGMALFCIGFLVWLAVLLVWQVVYFFARFAVALEDSALLEALLRGWRVFWANLGNVIVLGLIFIVISLAYAVVAMLPGLPALFSLLRWLDGADLPILPILAANMALAIPLWLAISAIYVTFHTSAWTLAYRDLIRPASREPQEAIVSLEEGEPHAPPV